MIRSYRSDQFIFNHLSNLFKSLNKMRRAELIEGVIELVSSAAADVFENITADLFNLDLKIPEDTLLQEDAIDIVCDALSANKKINMTNLQSVLTKYYSQVFTAVDLRQQQNVKEPEEEEQEEPEEESEEPEEEYEEVPVKIVKGKQKIIEEAFEEDEESSSQCDEQEQEQQCDEQPEEETEEPEEEETEEQE